MKSINQMVLLTVILGLVAVLINGPISVKPIFAEPPDPCFGDGCEWNQCDPFTSNSVQCCWLGPAGIPGGFICQICFYDDLGNLISCEPPTNKGRPDTGPIAPPPSGNAPPPSTEKCPDNSAVDQNGNCTPPTQSPDDTSDINKPNLRGNILSDMMSTQSQDFSDSGEEQKNQSND